MPVSVVLAGIPIVVALALLLARIGPVRSAVAALASAVVVTWVAFPASVSEIVGGQAKIGPVYAEVALILLGGVLLSQLLSASGAQRRLGEWVTGVCRDPARAVLLIVLGVVPFAESVTGFGIGVVVGVPLLVHFGFPRFRAAVVGLLGLVIVPWGALAPGTLVAAKLTGVGFRELGTRSALLSLPVFVIVGAGALLIATGARRTLAALPELAVVAGALWGGVWVVNTAVGTPLAGALGSLIAIAATLVLARAREGASLRLPARTARDLTPYAVLVTGLLATYLGTAAASVGDTWWTAVATSPATWLLATCAVTPALLAQPAVTRGPALRQALRRWWPVALTTVLFLSLGALLTSTGMSTALARGAVRLGAAYPALTPWIGALGGFVAGSNTGANAMFAASQAQAAQALGYPTLTLVAFQNVSAALATMAAIPKVALATSLAHDTPGPAPAEHREPGGAERPTGAAGTATAEQTGAVAHIDTGRILRTVLAVDVAVLAVLSGLAMVLPALL
ncbi:MAG: L-lactate permease [Streptosporangiaceae bacterium]